MSTNPIMFWWVNGEFLPGGHNCYAELFNGILPDTSFQNIEVVSNRLLVDIAKNASSLKINLNKEQV